MPVAVQITTGLSAAMASRVAKSSATIEVFPALSQWCQGLCPPGSSGARVRSDDPPGGSTSVTTAPSWASRRPHHAPATPPATSTTRMPCTERSFWPPWVGSSPLPSGGLRERPPGRRRGVQDCPAMEVLVAGFIAGDPDAVRGIYQRFARPVATVARSIVGHDQTLIDDVVQQTFTKAWQASHTIDPSRDLAPWIYAIARRTAIDAVRHERRPTRGDHAPETDAPVTSVSMEQTWEAFEVRQALDTLPPDERTVLLLNHVGGLSHTEIADRLGVPVGTVKSRSHRALRRLGASLQHLQTPTSLPGPDPGSGQAAANRPGPADVSFSRELP